MLIFFHSVEQKNSINFPRPEINANKYRKSIRIQVCSLISGLKFLAIAFSTDITVVPWLQRTHLIPPSVPWGLTQCQPCIWLLINSCWLNEKNNCHLSFIHYDPLCCGQNDRPSSKHIFTPLPQMRFLQLSLCQVHTHFWRPSSDATSSRKHFLRAQWCLSHLHISLPGTESKLTVYWMSRWMNREDRTTIYPTADKILGCVVFHRPASWLTTGVTLGKLLTASLWAFVSLVIK